MPRTRSEQSKARRSLNAPDACAKRLHGFRLRSMGWVPAASGSRGNRVVLPLRDQHSLAALGQTWLVTMERRPNNAFERTVRHRGPRLAAAQRWWPAAQLGR